MDNYLARVDGLDAPGDMGDAQTALELVYALRSNAMAEIAEKTSTALADVGAEKATEAIANQMRKLMASDVLYASVVRPEIDAALADNGIEGEDVPESVFVPDGTKWLDGEEVGSALGSVSGAVADAPGVHGLGLIGTSVNGTELVAESTTAVSGEETPEIEVQIQNQGESTENGITVTVTVDGTSTQGEISTVEAGEEATATIPLVSTPKGEVTLEVEAEPVPGEKVSENNEATYTVAFE